MGSFRFFVLWLFFIVACKNEGTLEGTTSSTLENKETTDKPLTTNLELMDFPESLLLENGLEEWEDFTNLYNSFDRLKELDLRDVEVNIMAISSRINKLISDKLPLEFETPQIRSRLKVVQMQAQKSRYFTKHYTKDSLIPSLKALYNHYNAFLSRMQILKEEESTVVSQTTPKIQS